MSEHSDNRRKFKLDDVKTLWENMKVAPVPKVDGWNTGHIHEERGMIPKNIDKLFKASDDAFMDQLIYGESMIKIDNEDGIRRIEPGSDEYFECEDSCCPIEYVSVEDLIDKYKDYLSEDELNKLKDFYGND